MTQTVDVGERSSQLDSSGAMDASTSATHRRAKVRTVAFTFGIAFTLLYTVLERLNWPLFTYQPAVDKLYFWLHRPLSGEGPPMYWYGWIVNAAIAAFVVGWIATTVSGQWLRRATIFCCALAALWPTALAGLRIYITDWATFDIGGTRVDKLAVDRAYRRTRRPRQLAPHILCAVAYFRRCDGRAPAVQPAVKNG